LKTESRELGNDSRGVRREPTASFLIAEVCVPYHRTDDLSERSFKFAADVYDYCQDLVPVRGLPCRLAYQLFDAAGVGGGKPLLTSDF
jgi:hypothetical protein